VRTISKLASFTADPNFPEIITSKSTRGEKIVFYEDLYKQYSRLAFSHPEDRPIAIAGLEKQLINDLKTGGGWGVFDDGQSLLRRSLLWQRGEDVLKLSRITFPPERKMIVPTWSWMAYEGGIGFLELPYGGVHWQDGGIALRGPSDAAMTNSIAKRSIELTGITRSYAMPTDTFSNFKVVYDDPQAKSLPLRCVVMGRKQEPGDPPDALHYVLFVTPRTGSTDVYERVGVGFLPGTCIEMDVPTPIKLDKIS
jgi:hypothetical protein